MAGVSRFAINIDDGRIVYRTTATDELDVLYKKVDDDTANAVLKGELSGSDVVNAIMSQERFTGVFNWKEYEKKRKSLNMRTSEVELEDSEPHHEDKLSEDKPGEVFEMNELKKIIGNTKKSRAKKLVDSVDSEKAKHVDAEPSVTI